MNPQHGTEYLVCWIDEENDRLAITDKKFLDEATENALRGALPGEQTIVVCSSVCRICTRPLYGSQHEEWHARNHANKLGLTV